MEWDVKLYSLTHSPTQKNSISTVVIVWRIRGKISRTVLCCIVYHTTIVLGYMCTLVSSSYRCTTVLALDLEGVHDVKLHHPSSSVATSN